MNSVLDTPTFRKPTDFEKRNDDKLLFAPDWSPVYILPGINIAMIAHGTNMSAPGISRIFSGSRNPRIGNIVSIARYLSEQTERKVTVDEVLDLIRHKPWKSKHG